MKGTPEQESAGGHRALTVATGLSLFAALAGLGLGIAADSMLVLAFAADKFADGALSALNRWGFAYSRRSADEGHPWGHGKAEGALSLGQGALLCAIAVSVVAGAVGRLFESGRAPDVWLSAGTLVGAMVLSAFLAWMLERAARRHGSLILSADAAHYRTDLYGAIGGLLGLLLVGLTGQAAWDALAAMVFAGLMAREGVNIGRKGLSQVMDETLDEAELQTVHSVLERFASEVVEFHGLRTRRSGPTRFVEVHAVLPMAMSLGDAHDIVQRITRSLMEALPRARVLVHPNAEGMHDVVDHAL